MRHFSKINPSVWGSKRFNALPDEARLFYLYCLTSPQSNSVGCYRNPVGYMMVDLSWKEAKIKSCIKKVSDTLLIQYHEEESVILIDRWFEYNPASNPKHALKLVSDIEAIPYPDFASISAQALKRCIRDMGWNIEDSLLYRMDRVSRLGDTETKTETKTETETKTVIHDVPSCDGISKDVFEEAINLYNELAEKYDLALAQVLSKKRKTALKARLKDCDGIEGWKIALKNVSESDFLTGRSKEAWKASLDFILQQSSFIKIMEGTYANVKKTTGTDKTKQDLSDWAKNGK